MRPMDAFDPEMDLLPWRFAPHMGFWQRGFELDPGNIAKEAH